PVPCSARDLTPLTAPAIAPASSIATFTSAISRAPAAWHRRSLTYLLRARPPGWAGWRQTPPEPHRGDRRFQLATALSPARAATVEPLWQSQTRHRPPQHPPAPTATSRCSSAAPGLAPFPPKRP